VIILVCLVLILGSYFKLFGLVNVEGDMNVFIGRSDYQESKRELLKENLFAEYISDNTPSDNREIYFKFLADVIQDSYVGLDFVQEEFDFEWEKIVEYYRSRVAKVEDDNQFFFLCQEMISLLDNQGHTYVRSTEDGEYDKALPINIKKDGEQFFVSGLHRAFTRSKEAINLIDLGDEIISIDGRKISDIYQKIVRESVYSQVDKTEYLLMKRFFQSYYYYIKDRNDSNKSIVKLKKSNGEEYDLTMGWGNTHNIKGVKMFTIKKEGISSRILNKDIGYIKIDSFNYSNFVEDFNTAFEEIRVTEGLIIDLRNNFGGDYTLSAQEVISKFISQRKVTSYKQFKNSNLFHIYGYNRPHYPGRIDYQAEYYPLIPVKCKPANQLYEKPVILLTNGYHFSAADMFITAFYDLNIGKIVGRLTKVSSFGQPIRFKNPWNDWQTGISVMNKLSPKKKTVRKMNIEPDIYVALTKEEITGEDDPILNSAIDSLNNFNKISFK
jgi:hypothetical protein